MYSNSLIYFTYLKPVINPILKKLSSFPLSPLPIPSRISTLGRGLSGDRVLQRGLPSSTAFGPNSGAHARHCLSRPCHKCHIFRERKRFCHFLYPPDVHGIKANHGKEKQVKQSSDNRGVHAHYYHYFKVTQIVMLISILVKNGT